MPGESGFGVDRHRPASRHPHLGIFQGLKEVADRTRGRENVSGDQDHQRHLRLGEPEVESAGLARALRLHVEGHAGIAGRHLQDRRHRVVAAAAGHDDHLAHSRFVQEPGEKWTRIGSVIVGDHDDGGKADPGGFRDPRTREGPSGGTPPGAWPHQDRGRAHMRRRRRRLRETPPVEARAGGAQAAAKDDCRLHGQKQ